MSRKTQLVVGLVLVLILAGSVFNLLSYPETESEDVSPEAHAAAADPSTYAPYTQLPLAYDPVWPVGKGLFPLGPASVNAQAPLQGKVYDCRFVTALASLASTEAGRKVILGMVEQHGDGSATVKFPGYKDEPVTVAPITPAEAPMVAYVVDAGTRLPTTWVSVIEKAYGKCRGAHQEPFEYLLHLLRHGIWYGRWTAAPLLDATGASYGMADDKAIQILSGDHFVFLDTFSMQCGDFGLGKGFLTRAQIKSWFNREAVLNELMDEQHRLFTNESRHGLFGVVLTDLAFQNASVGMKHNHAYAILGYDPRTTRLKLRDPYGKGDVMNPDGLPRDGVDDGVFEVSLRELNMYASHIALRVKS